MSRSLLLSFLVGSWILACSNCASKQVAEYERRQGSAPEPALHSVHHVRLRQIMSNLDRPGSRLPQELDSEKQQARRLQELAEIAGRLEAAAEPIAAVLLEVELSGEHARRFGELARRLGSQASALRRSAQEGRWSEARETMKRIDQTCDSCHEGFRILPSRRL